MENGMIHESLASSTRELNVRAHFVRQPLLYRIIINSKREVYLLSSLFSSAGHSTIAPQKAEDHQLPDCDKGSLSVEAGRSVTCDFFFDIKIGRRN
jgi:hypothetical protein